MKQMPLRAVFFDVGGTLIHPWPSVGELYAATARRHGITLAPEQAERAFRRCWAKRKGGELTVSRKEWWRDLVFQTLGQRNAACFDELFAVFSHAGAWRIYPDVEDTLREVHARGWHVGVISNWDDRLRPLANEIGLGQWLDSMTVSCEVGVEKPHAAIFLAALRAAGVSAGEALHVGDSYQEDVGGAEAVGMRAVLIRRHDEGAYSCPSVRDLRGVLDLVAR